MTNRLKELRLEASLTQDDCAKIAYIGKTTYYRYEHGERSLPMDVAMLLAEHYNTSVDYIVGKTDER